MVWHCHPNYGTCAIGQCKGGKLEWLKRGGASASCAGNGPNDSIELNAPTCLQDSSLDVMQLDFPEQGLVIHAKNSGHLALVPACFVEGLLDGPFLKAVGY